MICRSCSAIDLEVALSNLLVQDVECNILDSESNSSHCSQCKELDNLEKSIARLEMKRFELKRNINRTHSRFIRMIPAEIIAKISGFTNTHSTSLGRFLPSPILLSSVCSDWRRIVVGTPQLWSSIMIDTLHMSSTTDRHLAAFIDEYLGRSGQLPLHISITCMDEFRDFVGPGEFSGVFKILHNYSSRWHSLHISYAIIPCLQPDRLPILEQLTIELPTRMPDMSGYTLIFPPSPRLKAVEILGNQVKLPRLFGFGIQWDNVTRLSGEWLNIRGCFKFLRLLPKLVHCQFHNIYLDIDNPLQSPILSPLTHLSLSCSPMSPGPFLDNIVLPSLKSLVLFHVVSMDPLMAFLERSACSLHTLSLQRSNIESLDVLTQLLQFLSPSLTKLVIFPTLPNVKYLSILTKTYTSQSAGAENDFLPLLENFGYRYSDAPDPDESFEFPALRTRDPKPTLSPISLRSAYIDVGRVIHEPISQDILSILQRINEDGILNTPRASPLNGLL